MMLKIFEFFWLCNNYIALFKIFRIVQYIFVYFSLEIHNRIEHKIINKKVKTNRVINKHNK